MFRKVYSQRHCKVKLRSLGIRRNFSNLNYSDLFTLYGNKNKVNKEDVPIGTEVWSHSQRLLIEFFFENTLAFIFTPIAACNH